MLLSKAPSEAESALRAYANASPERISILSAADYQTHESRLIVWLMTAIKLLSFAAVFALMLSVLTQGLVNAASRSRLYALGADGHRTAYIAAGESAVTVGAAGLFGLFGGLMSVLAYGNVSNASSVTLWPIVFLAATILGAALVAACGAAVMVIGDIRSPTWNRRID